MTGMTLYLLPPGAFGPVPPAFEGSCEIVICLVPMCDKTRAARGR
jgi:hypothetical protein